ncbi:hypothetical protein HYY74_00400 [Candidatus Woesearchaeota archaeon]|nr:hypothetical protein [Candidatus Woesearchaeota archaeon]
MFNEYNEIGYLEPRCPTCKTVLEYGTNTEFSDEHEAHVCLGCNEVLK